MTDIEKQQRFVCLRAEGWTFDRLAEDLQTSKPTLIKWSRRFQFDIQNHRAILRERLAEKWLSNLDDRVNALGEKLQKIEAELAKRDVSSLSTGHLFSLADSLRRQIKREIGDITFSTPASDIPSAEYVDEVHDWKP
jgi:transcriptional regulator